MAQQQRQTFVLLDEDDNRQVVVHPRNCDKFVLPSAQAVAACYAFDQVVIGMQRQFDDLLDRLAKWVETHRSQIRAAHVAARGGNRFLFVVTQKYKPFDSELADALVELDIDIANDHGFNLLELDVMAIPSVSRDSAEAFLSSGQVFTHAE